MRILMVSVHFNLPGDSIPIGGVQKHISKITEEFAVMGDNVQWCYPSEVPLKIKEFSPHIIIAHDFVSFTENCPIPQIVVFHGWEGRIPLNPAVIERRQEVEKKAAASICVGDYIKRWYGQKPDLVIYGGVEVKEEEEEREIKINQLLYVGRLAPDCSPHIFLQAIAQLKENCKLVMLGDGPLRGELEKMVRELRVNVEFKGFVDNVSDYIKESTLVLTSGYLSILEAYAERKAVISVYDNDLKEDYLKLMPCPPYVFNTPEEVAEKINYVIYKCSQERENENFRFAEKNTWQNLADKYYKIMGKILRK